MLIYLLYCFYSICFITSGSDALGHSVQIIQQLDYQTSVLSPYNAAEHTSKTIDFDGLINIEKEEQQTEFESDKISNFTERNDIYSKYSFDKVYEIQFITNKKKEKKYLLFHQWKSRLQKIHL